MQNINAVKKKKKKKKGLTASTEYIRKSDRMKGCEKKANPKL